MANRNTFITEVTVDFEYPFKTAYNQTFQIQPVSYTHLRAHETDSYLVCRLLLEKKKKRTLYEYQFL